MAGLVVSGLVVVALGAGQAGLRAGNPPTALGVTVGRLKAPSMTDNSVSSQAGLWNGHPMQRSAMIAPLPLEIVADAGAYDAHRIRLGIPEGGRDFIYGDTFPHEADMDQLAGVDFHKGCYVGQEVVSRMQHRGTARTRVIPIAFPDFPPMEGLDVTAGDKTIGVMGSAAEGHGLAKLRLDRVADALAAGEPITAGGIAISPRKPDWARFDWPEEAAAG